MAEVVTLTGQQYQVSDAEAERLRVYLSEENAHGDLMQIQSVPAIPAAANLRPTTTLAEALARVQAEIPEVIKTEEAKVKSDKGDYKYSYADLSAVTRAILPMLGRVGLSWVTLPTVQDGKFMLVYRLMHASGDFIEGSYPLPAGLSPQQTGSAITYARRYCLCSVTGVAPSDDDDAAEAQAAYRRGENGATEAPARAGMSQFERNAGLAVLALPTEGQRKSAGSILMRAAFQQALDFRLCLDEHRAWGEPAAIPSGVTWAEMLAARVANEIEHADTQPDLTVLWTMLKTANYNPETEGKTMTSRIKERAAAIVARNAETLDALGKLIVEETEVAELENTVVPMITKAYADYRITEAESHDLTRMMHDRVIKLQRNPSGSAYDEDGHKPTSPELRGAAPVDGDDPWGATE